MKLTILGGASAGPNAGQGCSGYLVEEGATQLVLDLGPGTLLELRRHADYRRLSAVVLSHLHIDHMLDLIALYWLLQHNPEPPPAPIPLFLPPGGLEFLRDLGPVLAKHAGDRGRFDDVFNVAEFDPARPLEIGDLRLSFTPTVHYIPCWAIRVHTSDGRDLVYTADTGPESDLVECARGAHVLVAEAMLLERAEGATGSSTAAEAAMLASEAGAEVLVITHLWGEYGFKNYRDQAARVFKGRLEVAWPGLRIEW